MRRPRRRVRGGWLLLESAVGLAVLAVLATVLSVGVARYSQASGRLTAVREASSAATAAVELRRRGVGADAAVLGVDGVEIEELGEAEGADGVWVRVAVRQGAVTVERTALVPAGDGVSR